MLIRFAFDLTAWVFAQALAPVQAVPLQGEGAIPPSWLGVIVQLGCFGIVAFLVWYFAARYLPGRDAREKAEREARDLREKEEREKRDILFANALRAVTDDSRADRETYHAAAKAAVAAVEAAESKCAAERIRAEDANRVREQSMMSRLDAKDAEIKELLRQGRLDRQADRDDRNHGAG